MKLYSASLMMPLHAIPLSIKLAILSLKMLHRKVLGFSANAISGSHITLQEYAAFTVKCKNLKTKHKLLSKSKLL